MFCAPGESHLGICVSPFNIWHEWKSFFLKQGRGDFMHNWGREIEKEDLHYLLIENCEISVIKRKIASKDYIQDDAARPYVRGGTVIPSVGKNLWRYIVGTSTCCMKQAVVLAEEFKPKENKWACGTKKLSLVLIWNSWYPEVLRQCAEAKIRNFYASFSIYENVFELQWRMSDKVCE